MKINVNYDLLDAASQANDGLSFKLYQKNNLKNPFTYVNLGLMITQMTLLSEFNEISIPFYGALFITQGVILKYFNSNRMGDMARENGLIKLDTLSLELLKLDVITTKELLKDSKLDSKKFRLEYKDDDSSIKSIKEYKYIDVPLTNGYTETLVQEHFLGSEDYDLSIGKNIKSKQFKPLKNGI